MDALTRLIDINFGRGNPPSQAELVSHSGADTLDKESALELFLRKTKEEVLAGILTGEFGEHWDVEKLVVLEQAGLQYYLWSYLHYFAAGHGDTSENADMVEWLLSSIRSILGLHGSSFFHDDQAKTLRNFTTVLRQRFLSVQPNNSAAISYHIDYILNKLQ